MSELRQRLISTPIGELRVVASARALVAVYFPDQRGAQLPRAPEDPGSPVLDRAVAQLREYLAGTRRSFELELAPRGTAFQREVWSALTTIGYGETRSYAELAAMVGRPRASRAVGAANGRNPLSLIVPCHRVVGSDGSLTGYAGGVERKRWLLELEGSLEPRQVAMDFISAR